MKLEECIGQNIRTLREAWGLSQAELGERVGKMLGKEWTRQAVSLAEKGRRSFTAAEVAAFAYVLQRSPGSMFEPSNTGSAVTIGESTLSWSELVSGGTKPEAADVLEKAMKVIEEAGEAINQRASADEKLQDALLAVWSFVLRDVQVTGQSSVQRAGEGQADD